MKLLAILGLLFVYSYSSAQESYSRYGIGLQINTIPERNAANYNPNGGYWNEEADLYQGPGINVRDLSFSVGLTGTKVKRDNNVWRVRAGVIRTSVNSDWSYTDATFTYAYQAQKKQLDYYLVPGVYKEFHVFKANYYAGMEVPVTVYGRANVSKAYSYSSINTGEQLYLNETTGKINNGYSFGLAPFGGFTITFLEDFTFGPEVGFALLFSDFGSRSEFTTSVVNGSSYGTAESFNSSYRKAGIAQPYGSFILSYRL